MHKLLFTLVVMFNALSSFAQGHSSQRTTAATGGGLGRITYSGGGGHNNPMPSSIGEPFGGNRHGVTLGSQQNSIYATTGVKKLLPPQVSFVAYPNPTSGQINIKITGAADCDYTATLYDLLGKKVQTEVISKPQSVMDIANLPNAVYFLCFTNKQGEKVFNQTIVKN